MFAKHRVVQVVSIAVPLVSSTLLSRNIQTDVKNWCVLTACDCLCSLFYSRITCSGTIRFTRGSHAVCAHCQSAVLGCRYQYLRQPSWKPPRWVFGVVWPILYTLMGTASWLVWHNGGWQHSSAALIMYAIQLALNLSWPPLFFSGHRLGLALADSTGEHT